MYINTKNEYLAHHGILGMKWGVRRFQNKDGSLTSQGRKRHGEGDSESESADRGIQRNRSTKEIKKAYKEQRTNILDDRWKFDKEYEKTSEYKELRKEYDKAYDNYFNKQHKDERAEKEAEEAFSKTEERFLRACQEYSGRKLVEKYGNDLISTYVNSVGYNIRVEKGRDAVKDMSDKWWVHAE